MSLRRPLALVLIGLAFSITAPQAQAQGENRPRGATISKDPQAPRRERTILCRGAEIPAGWVLVNDMRDPNSCGGDNPATLNAYNVWSVERVQGRAIGTVIDICAAAPTPAGWVIVDVYRDRDMCGHPDGLFVANVKRIRRSS